MFRRLRHSAARALIPTHTQAVCRQPRLPSGTASRSVRPSNTIAFTTSANPVSDIDTGVADSLKVLDPDSRLEKRTWSDDLCLVMCLASCGHIAAHTINGGSVGGSLKREPRPNRRRAIRRRLPIPLTQHEYMTSTAILDRLSKAMARPSSRTLAKWVLKASSRSARILPTVPAARPTGSR